MAVKIGEKRLYLLFWALVRSVFAVWTVVRSSMLKAYPTLSLDVLGNDFKCLSLFGVNGILNQKLL